MKGGIHILIGQILENRYCILSEIGRGGEGTMYLARDMNLGTFWAIKQLPLSMKKEAKLLRSLEHPSLPRMTDYIEQDEFCYLVMEYIKGKSLSEYLKDDNSFSFEQILTITKTILQIFQYLHSRKPSIYYGDLKPDNLMYTETGKIYLVDFGSALCSYGAVRKDVKGTKGYAAPEQYRGIMTASSDLYALGKTIQKLCGKKKWKYYLYRPQFAGFIYRCCHQEPSRRWQQASDAEVYLNKIRTESVNLSSVLAVICAVLVTIAAGTFRSEVSPSLPEFQSVLSSVTDLLYSMEYRNASVQTQQEMNLDIEKKLQKMLKFYRKKEEQIRILELLAWNGELLGKANKAEFYYRQLITYETEYGAGYLEFGNFLCRQKRYEESMEVYREWEKQTMEKKMDNSCITSEQTERWKKQAEQK